jgi:hypothetical protein
MIVTPPANPPRDNPTASTAILTTSTSPANPHRRNRTTSTSIPHRDNPIASTSIAIPRRDIPITSTATANPHRCNPSRDREGVVGAIALITL